MAAHLWHRVHAAQPTKFITLTCNPTKWTDPRHAYKGTTRQLCIMARRIREKWGDFQYLRVLEQTAAGWPHYHMLARTGFIAQKWLSTLWDHLTGAPIVDIRKIKDTDTAIRYATKYLTKQGVIAFTRRRMSWSKTFFPEEQLPLRQQSFWQAEDFRHTDPVTYVEVHLPDSLWDVTQSDFWIRQRPADPLYNELPPPDPTRTLNLIQEEEDCDNRLTQTKDQK